MSQTGPSSAAHLTDAYPLNLTVVVLLLLPCVLLLLLLNCFFLVYKLLILIKRKRRRRGDTEEVLLRSTLPRVRLSDAVFSPLQDAGRAYMSVSEPVLPHPVTSSRASSRERLGVNDRVRVRLLRPDGATGSGSLRAPSSIRAASSAFTPRLEAPWSRSAPVLTQSSCSETETRINLVPPNSPTVSPGAAQTSALISPRFPANSNQTSALNQTDRNGQTVFCRIFYGCRNWKVFEGLKKNVVVFFFFGNRCNSCSG